MRLRGPRHSPPDRPPGTGCAADRWPREWSECRSECRSRPARDLPVRSRSAARRTVVVLPLVPVIPARSRRRAGWPCTMAAAGPNARRTEPDHQAGNGRGGRAALPACAVAPAVTASAANRCPSLDGARNAGEEGAGLDAPAVVLHIADGRWRRLRRCPAARRASAGREQLGLQRSGELAERGQVPAMDRRILAPLVMCSPPPRPSSAAAAPAPVRPAGAHRV